MAILAETAENRGKNLVGDGEICKSGNFELRATDGGENQ